ncbi:MAG: Lrp/AsnC family transcriptional regulator [Dehalococcoidia bacterium]|nr:Lrp/AsnC family transcriptional regulator [Dehalococcoidia bacterium]
MKAYILIEATIGRAREVSRAVKSVPGVRESYLIMGPYDVVAIVEGLDASAVGNTVTGAIHKVPGISRTVTCLAVGIQ